MGSAGVQAEAAAMLRRLLEKVERGDMEAKGGQGARLVRRLEGAATAWEESARRPRTSHHHSPNPGAGPHHRARHAEAARRSFITSGPFFDQSREYQKIWFS